MVRPLLSLLLKWEMWKLCMSWLKEMPKWMLKIMYVLFFYFCNLLYKSCNLPTVSYMYWGLTKPHNLKLCFWKDMVMTLRDMFILEMGIWMIKCCRPSLTVNMLMCNEDSLRVVLWSRVQRYKSVLQQYCKIVISCPGFLTNTNSEKRFYII